ncbi:MAG: M28 family peptidase [Anaeroplasmataceae bacterium]|nr:M28 family peptidase [Anaeroplasmataceae bacterium]MDE6414697.1 M28 family peptidase [Anaeroplasmataceae bacterium]
MERFDSFEFLKKIAYERTGGSEEELKTANLIITECHKFQVEAHLEEFLIDGYEIKKAMLETIDGAYEVTGVGMSGSTPIEGIIGELVVIESDEQLKHLDSLEGKIAYVSSRMMIKTYKQLCEKKASAFICTSGSLYDDIANSDLEKMMIRERHYQHGKIPGVCMRMIDAQKLLLSSPKEVKITLQQDEFKLTSHNVIATIPGTVKKNEIVCFTAHYDSVPFSTGAYDNGTGTTTILEALAYFSKHRPSRTLKFIWCGSEEMGLLGSKAFTDTHQEELLDYKLCINVDMTGVVIGKDIACCTSEMSLVNYINYMGCEVGFPITAKQGVYSSDSTPFADHGVPALSFARLAPRGGAEIHSRKDIIDFLDQENYYRTAEFIIQFAQRMIESTFFPVDATIPEEMKKELDIYLGRKEREEK